MKIRKLKWPDKIIKALWVIFLFMLFPKTIYAKPIVENGLDINLIVDEATNNDSEAILHFDIKNNNDYPIFNVKLSIDEIEKIECNQELTVSNIAANEEKRVDIPLRKIAASVVDDDAELNKTQPNAKNNVQPINEQVTNTNYLNGEHESVPSTNDNLNIFLWSCIFVISIIVIVILKRKFNIGFRNTVNLFICVSMSISCLNVTQNIKAKTSLVNKQINIDELLNIFDEEVRFSARLDYQIEFNETDIEDDICVVKFVDGSDTEYKCVTVKKSSIVNEPKSPEKQGYTFAGWYVDELCTTKYDFNSKVTENIILYAKWDSLENSLQVNFMLGIPNEYLNNADEFKQLNVVEGSQIKEPVEPKCDYAIFIDWYNDPNFETEFDFESEIDRKSVV